MLHYNATLKIPKFIQRYNNVIRNIDINCLSHNLVHEIYFPIEKEYSSANARFKKYKIVTFFLFVSDLLR